MNSYMMVPVSIPLGEREKWAEAMQLLLPANEWNMSKAIRSAVYAAALRLEAEQAEAEPTAN